MFTLTPKVRTFAITVDECPHDPKREFAVIELFNEPINPLGQKSMAIPEDDVIALLEEIKEWKKANVS
jgi:hypothetical protein